MCSMGGCLWTRFVCGNALSVTHSRHIQVSSHHLTSLLFELSHTRQNTHHMSPERPYCSLHGCTRSDTDRSSPQLRWSRLSCPLWSASSRTRSSATSGSVSPQMVTSARETRGTPKAQHKAAAASGALPGRWRSSTEGLGSCVPASCEGTMDTVGCPAAREQHEDTTVSAEGG